MEKIKVERELKAARYTVVILGVLSWFLMTLSEYADETFRWSLIFFIGVIMIFTYAVITFLLGSLINK